MGKFKQQLSANNYLNLVVCVVVRQSVVPNMCNCVGCENEYGDQSDKEVYLSDDDENINADWLKNV